MLRLRRYQFGAARRGRPATISPKCLPLICFMRLVRRFLIASSLARLITRERPATRIVEGHFAPSDNRMSYVFFEDDTCSLVLITNPGAPDEEEDRTEVPPKQGQFLLEVCAGTLVWHRLSLPLESGQEAEIKSFSVPGSLHLIELGFEDQKQADNFTPPLWFGPEVREEPAFDHNAMAVSGIPKQPPVPVTDVSLHAVLDLLEGRARPRWPANSGAGSAVVERLRPVQRTSAEPAE
jgi:CYTH domain-containing protein